MSKRDVLFTHATEHKHTSPDGFEGEVSGRFSIVDAGGLPIFRADEAVYSVFYAPRCPVAVPIAEAPAVERELARAGATDYRIPRQRASSEHHSARRLIEAARSAVETAAAAADGPFTPEGLTLFLNNACMLDCRYCHAQPGSAPDVLLTDEAVSASARMVAESCAVHSRIMTLALHGGGEPLFDRDEADRVLRLVRAEALRAGVRLQTYVATGGVLPEETARWAAEEFDLIGLSCDGPPDIQDVQRPTRAGGATAAVVERTADILWSSGTRFHVRATVTRETLDRQAEIVNYAARRLRSAEVRLEPVYANPAGMAELVSRDAERFVDGFLAARHAGAVTDVRVTTSLVRPDEVYGPHCNALRSVINLVPGDYATGCFLESRTEGLDRRGVRMGGPDHGFSRSRVFALDYERITRLRSAASVRPAACATCICAFQCSRACPDICVLEPEALSFCTGSFRCRAQRLLMEALVLESALSGMTGEVCR